MWGKRVVIPQKLQSRMVEELHRGHPGMAHMKSVAHSYSWWPGQDKAGGVCAELCLLPSCEECASTRTSSPMGVAK